MQPQLFLGFLSISQTTAQVVYNAAFGDACGGTSMSTNSYGRVDTSREVALDGEALHCPPGCAKEALVNSFSEPECLGVVFADVVFYNDKAYEADPEDARMKGLVEKIDLDEQLITAELQQLEAIRLPELDYLATAATNGNQADSREVSSEAPDKCLEDAKY